MDRAALQEAWTREAQHPFSGWDWSYLEGRMVETLPWSYEDQAEALMETAASVLDLGTGGGEFLAGLVDDWPRQVAATEGYPPNLAIATQRLEPLGARVVEATVSEVDAIPFGDDAFDLVLARHSAFNASEVARVLVPGGRFHTQQVHGQWARDLMARFGASPQWPDGSVERSVSRLVAAGFTIVECQDWHGDLTFTDVGALVYMLTNTPWVVPGFGVESHIAPLMALHAQLLSEGRLTFTSRKYLISATLQ